MNTAILADAPSHSISGPANDTLQPKRDAIAARELAISEAEAECASLVAEDQRLCAAINENRRLAALPEPVAVDFQDLQDWHQASRQWRADHARLEEELPSLEQDRNRLAMQRIPAARNSIDAMRRELAWLEFDAAKDEHSIAQLHADQVLRRVRHLQAHLPPAR